MENKLTLSAARSNHPTAWAEIQGRIADVEREHGAAFVVMGAGIVREHGADHLELAAVTELDGEPAMMLFRAPLVPEIAPAPRSLH